ncbi:uncharacterized protein LOC122251855 [Penaeus japonicus]|uniref:uncharacterized protein LOC122251855 n=1 Tax=Penaeus japonicus TaxID=27405 RepID=UPI001C70FD68|nr:uncharacterized protein LOC122251855 [Penaeus japonicus]
MEAKQQTDGDVFSPPQMGIAQKRMRIQQGHQIPEFEREEQDSSLPGLSQRSQKHTAEAGGASDVQADSEADAIVAADAAADPPRFPGGSGGRPRVSFPERYGSLVKQVHEDLDTTFQEQYRNLCELQQEEDAVMERVQKLREEAYAANSDIEQQVSRIVERMKTALDRIQRNMV